MSLLPRVKAKPSDRHLLIKVDTMAHVARLLKSKVRLRNRKANRRDFGQNHDHIASIQDDHAYEAQFESATTSHTKGETDAASERWV